MTLLMQRRMKTGSLAERYDGQGPHELREFERERVTSVCSFATSRGSAPARAVRSPMSASCRRRRRASASSTSVRVPSWSMPHHDGSHKPTAAGEQQENGLGASGGRQAILHVASTRYAEDCLSPLLWKRGLARDGHGAPWPAARAFNLRPKTPPGRLPHAGEECAGPAGIRSRSACFRLGYGWRGYRCCWGIAASRSRRSIIRPGCGRGRNSWRRMSGRVGSSPIAIRLQT